MADVRALLRQQRQSRRIEHPHAAYSDAGKLLCTLCRQQIRAETQWESHTRSTSHQRRAAAATTTTNAGPAPSERAEPVTDSVSVTQEHDTTAVEGPQEEEQEGVDGRQNPQASSNGTESRTTQAHKRKMSDDDYDDADAMDLDEAIRRKRSRGDISIDVSAANHRRGSGTDKDTDPADAAAANPPARRDAANRTPPTLARRMSSTPSRGVELQIPSRPATPAAHRDSSSSSTTTPGLSTLAGLSAAMAAHTAGAAPSAAKPTTNGSTISTEKLSGGGGGRGVATQVDEDEWAAFEAEMAATAVPYADDAVISAPAMNADEAATAAEAAAAGGNGGGGGGGSRKSRADLDIEGEREDAARAREDEMSDMQELEARVRRLKEKREELRQRASSIGQENSSGPARLQSQVPDEDGKSPGLENGEARGKAEDDEDDDEDEEDEDDDWDGFRFRR